MKDSEPKLKIEFLPGCFNDFDGTQEELDEMILELTKLVESGEIFEKSVAVTDENIDSLPDDIVIWLKEQNKPYNKLLN
jgi:hypothetical protein